MSPGLTESFPEALAKIFSVKVIPISCPSCDCCSFSTPLLALMWPSPYIASQACRLSAGGSPGYRPPHQARAPYIVMAPEARHLSGSVEPWYRFPLSVMHLEAFIDLETREGEGDPWLYGVCYERWLLYLPSPV